MNEYQDQGIFLKVHLSLFRSGLAAQLKAVNMAVLICICSYMTEEGEARPTVRQIADQCGVSKRTVTRSIKELLAFRVAGKPILTREFIKDGDQILHSKYKVHPISQISIFNGKVEQIPNLPKEQLFHYIDPPAV